MRSDELFEWAVADAQAGRLEEAERKCRKILEQDPGHLQANLMTGIAAARSSRELEAVNCLAIVLEQEPDNTEALKWMAGAMNRMGRFAEAIPFAQRALAVGPDDFAVLLALGQALAMSGRIEDSVEIFQRAVRVGPKREAAYRSLYQSLIALGRRQEARAVLIEASGHIPSPWIHLRLAEVALGFGWAEEAIRWAEKVPAGYPEEETALLVLAAAYLRAGMAEKEVETLDRLEKVNPNNGNMLMLRGGRLQVQGHFESAEREFSRAIEVRPKLGEAYHGIVSGRRVTESDRTLVEKMEAVIAAGDLMPDEAGPLHFALGKAYEDLGRYGDAMSQFVVANECIAACRMGARTFDKLALERDVDRTIGLFTKEFLEAHREDQSYEPTPIIIAGAMRSGTTLVEQMLSAHPQVGATGEQVFWRSVADECVSFEPKGVVHRDVLRKRAKEYVRRARTLAPGKEYITDKDPGNHRLFGLLFLALPNSPLIQLRRNLADVAISMFTTYFQTAEEYVWDRSDIVFALKQHVRLENHWREVLPAGRFLEIDYSDLVTNPEASLRRLLSFCSLEWDESCLRTEDNSRQIHTPSFWQVRQPVNARSVERWRRYEQWLGPIAELVEG
jgi:tetratricopeptide (TPR) repeat protein